MAAQTKQKTKSKSVGSVLRNKDKEGFYIRFSEEIEFRTTDKSGKVTKTRTKFLNLEKPSDTIKRLASLGFITQEEAEARLEKVPDFVQYEVSVAVPQGE